LNLEGRDTSSMKSASIRVSLGPFAIGGNSPLYDLSLIELKRDGRVYLTFQEGVTPIVGDIYHIVRPAGSHGVNYFSWGRPRKTVAKVRILAVSGDTRAEVRILRGSVVGGTSAEKD
jgi:hypothetical protein